MSKKLKITAIDFDFGIGDIIPATQEAYSGGQFVGAIRKTEKDSLSVFKNTVGADLDARLAQNENFPSDGGGFCFYHSVFCCRVRIPAPRYR